MPRPFEPSLPLRVFFGDNPDHRIGIEFEPSRVPRVVVWVKRHGQFIADPGIALTSKYLTEARAGAWRVPWVNGKPATLTIDPEGTFSIEPDGEKYMAFEVKDPQVASLYATAFAVAARRLLATIDAEVEA